MKIGCFTITYEPFTTRGKVKAVYYSKSGNKADKREAAYKAYRDLTGVDVKASHVVCKKYFRKWEGKK